MIPSQELKQLLLTELRLNVRFEGSFNIKDAEWVHPRESVIETKYVPAFKDEIFSVLIPLFQLNEYGGVPPVVVKSILPSEFELQEILYPL